MMMLRGARGKAILWLGIFSLISASLFFSTLDLGRSLSMQLVYLRGTLTGDASLNLEETCHEPLKVYMYDIPSRFNMGMLKPDGNLRLPWVDKRFPPWPERSGLKKQHSIEYWMMASLLNKTQGRREDRAAVRVADPEQADVFFMPFFASLSFNIHGKTMTDPETEKDRQLQVEVLRMLRESPWWQRSEGRDHVLVLHHPNAFRFLRDKLNASILIVADFGRFPKNVSRLMKDVVAPYAHVVDTYSNDNKWDPYGSRPTLLFFRGRTIRKAGGAVRKRLVRVLQNQSRVTFEDSMASPQGFDLSTVGMRSSKFCLHPAGDTPSSCRLFDAIVSHCVPVIVSDQIELPFEDELDYREFCLFFSVNEAIKPGYLLGFLNAFPKKKWLQMWRRLREVSHHFEFQHPSRKDDAVNMIWKQVQRKAPAVKLAVHRSKRLKIPDWWRYF